jgi:hypothetical protein
LWQYEEEQSVIYAPSGKLGVTIDRDRQFGPVVYHVRDDSPLIGILNEGDRLLFINNTDVAEMSASAVTAHLMSGFSDNQRLLIINRRKPMITRSSGGTLDRALAMQQLQNDSLRRHRTRNALTRNKN